MTWHIPDDEHREIARNQRSYLKQVSLKIEQGEPLTTMDRQVAAAALWHCADQIPDQAPRAKGAAPKVDAGRLALEFAFLVRMQAMNQTPAMDVLAERFQMSTPAVRKSLTKYGIERALAMIPAAGEET